MNEEKEKLAFQPPFKAESESGWIWDANNTHALTVRGWGFLTGTGGLHLSETEAAKIQDDFQEHVAVCLNNHDALVEALEGYMQMLRTYCCHPDHMSAIGECEKLLEEANGE